MIFNLGLGSRDRNFPVVTIEANVLVLWICVVQHDVVVAEEGISNKVSRLWRSILPIDEELASVLGCRLVVRAYIWNRIFDSEVFFLHCENILSELFVCL